jgi:hypothetical protein
MSYYHDLQRRGTNINEYTGTYSIRKDIADTALAGTMMSNNVNPTFTSKPLGSEASFLCWKQVFR